MLKIEKLTKTAPVYDVTVKSNENFYANGVLVHNCGEILLRDREFCNLSEAIIRATDTPDDLERKVRIAALIGTLQSTLTDFKYISKKWQQNCEEERLLGVSLTGIMDSDVTNGKKKGLPELLQRLRQAARDENERWSDVLGVSASKAVTCVKPSGCTTLDTRIRVKDSGVWGTASMAKLFATLGPDDYSPEAGDWIVPSRTVHVLDENNEERAITKLYVNGVAEVYEVKTDDGETFKFTGEHKLKTSTGWKRVDELAEGDEVISF